VAAIILILRPQPGADETAARAAALGLEGVVAPLFEVRALEWRVPETDACDALLLTSANAPRHAGSGLADLASLPCYCVGEGTAAAARNAGLVVSRIGPSDGSAVAEMMAADGIRRVLHLGGRDHVGLEHPELGIAHVPVYASEALDRLPAEAEAAIHAGALVLIHSPRAGRLFAAIIDAAGVGRGRIRLAAISDAAAGAAGEGWADKAIAAAPRDQALLELAAKLCNIDAVKGTGLAR
jgi:uroporphyrinogen-III synthase